LIRNLEVEIRRTFVQDHSILSLLSSHKTRHSIAKRCMLKRAKSRSF